MSTTHRIAIATALCVLLLTLESGMGVASANEPPVAEAGLPRYAATDPVQLDGSGSYDADSSGSLGYAWTQISGPPVVTTGANTATPTISGFVQTNGIQECEFELVVHDGQLPSPPDTVKVIIVPDFGPVTLELQNPPFDTDKPTVFYPSGGDCVNGFADEQPWGNTAWYEKANVISFPAGYAPDASTGDYRTYYNVGDMIIVYLSRVAPDYEQPIQVVGWSTGGQPAVDAGIHLNRVYKDRRYAVNHVTELDAPCRWMPDYSGGIGLDAYLSSNALFLTSAVDGEPCWHDHYWGEAFPLLGDARQELLGVWLVGYDHVGVRNWYWDSLTNVSANQFNHGVVAGAYWSVVGPGRNLQLASTPGAQTYTFQWTGSPTDRRMEFYDESSHPGRLPEPVALGGWVSRSELSGAVEGAVLSCDACENAVGYQLLFGTDPHRIADFRVVSDTPAPPMEVIEEFPLQETWWTVRVRDPYGSTIYADPIRLDPTSLPPMSVENARLGRRYALINHAIRDAEPGHVILLHPGMYEESIEFGATPVTIRSLDPNDAAIVAATIIRGNGATPTVTFSGPESTACVLAGLTIQNENVGISCRDAAPTVSNCVVECPDGIAVEFWHGFAPQLIDCTLLGQVREGGDPGLVAYWKLDETDGVTARDSEGGFDGTLIGDPVWQPAGGIVRGALQLDGIDDYVGTPYVLTPSGGPFSVFAWVKGGAGGQAILSQGTDRNWLGTVPTTGSLMVELTSDVVLRTRSAGGVVTDGGWHNVGVSWDGSSLVLYVDDAEIGRQTYKAIPGREGGKLRIGAACDLSPGTFWSGLIDDVRIYDRAVKP